MGLGTQAEESSGPGSERPGNDLPPGEGVREQEHPDLLGQTHEKDRRKHDRLPDGGRTPAEGQGSHGKTKDQDLDHLAAGDGKVQQRTVLRLTEQEFLELARKKGLGDWDMEVALGALKKGVTLDLGDRVRYSIQDSGKI